MTANNERTANMENFMISDDTLAVNALDAAVATIQDVLGQTDGGFASIYFAGERGAAILLLLEDYIAAERAHMAGDA